MVRLCDRCGKKLRFVEGSLIHPPDNVHAKPDLVCDLCFQKEQKRQKLELKTTKELIDNNYLGELSILLGIIGILTYFFIGLFIGFPGISALAFPIGFFAVIFGVIAKKREYANGKYGIILGVISMIFGLITLIASFIYIYVSNLI